MGAAEPLREEHLALLRACARSLSLKRAAAEAGLRYSAARRLLSEASGVVEMRFLVNFPAARLVPAATLSGGGCPEWLARTFVSKLEGTEELTLCVGLAPYKQAVEAEVRGYDVIRGLELVYWDHTRPPSRELRQPVEEDFVAPKLPRVYPVKLDVVDAALISFKLDAPLARVSKAYWKARSLDSSLPNLTPSMVEYHFTRHVEPLWVGNAFYLGLPTCEEAVQVYLVEGWRSCALARVASALRGFWFSLLDEKRALVVARFGGREKASFYRGSRALGVRIPYGELIAPPGEERYLRPLLWKSLREFGWEPRFEYVEARRPVFP